ncbi:MAG: hypothetical protein R3F21_25035 [Myxococcota bacterium]
MLDAGNPGALDPEHLANVVSFAPLIAAHSIARLIWPTRSPPTIAFRGSAFPRRRSVGGCLALIALAGAGLILLALRRRPIVAFHCSSLRR